VSPGAVKTEIGQAGGFAQQDDDWFETQGFPALKDSDVSQAVTFLLMTDYSVNLTEIIIKPTGESF
jgi:NADP-dependent 3-hydroxy acid dehydrogenase YdfG